MIFGIQKNVILRFWAWYYSEAIKDLIRGWRNFIIFVKEYYSIPLLLRTLLHPWRRDITKYGRGFSFKKFFETLTFNVISRGLGFLVRFFTILLGLICLLGVIVVGLAILILWIFLPLILLILIISGIFLLFSQNYVI